MKFLKKQYIESVISSTGFEYNWKKIYNVWTTDDGKLFYLYYTENKSSNIYVLSFETIVTSKWFIDKLYSLLSGKKITKVGLIERQGIVLYEWGNILNDWLKDILIKWIL